VAVEASDARARLDWNVTSASSKKQNGMGFFLRKQKSILNPKLVEFGKMYFELQIHFICALNY
jgi:hypothetical protein